MEIPVYIFAGFLEAGKTQFLQGTLEDERFNDGERTLVLLCEDGEIELDSSRYPAPVTVEIVEKDSLNPFELQKMAERARAQRVLIEYNGMWLLDDLYQNLPEDWVLYQQFTFADATGFIAYNANMRQLTVDKLKNADMVVFNRTNDSTDKEQLHKIVRGVNRRCDILYEYPNGTVEPDETVDPLPYDINADIIRVEDRDYAIWYREVSEEPEKYDGKTVRIKAMTVKSPEIPEGSFIAGRHVMTCCVEDIQFAGFMCNYSHADRLSHRSWNYITATIRFMYHPVYGQKGPVLIAKEVVATSAPEERVATFY